MVVALLACVLWTIASVLVGLRERKQVVRLLATGGFGLVAVASVVVGCALYTQDHFYVALVLVALLLALGGGGIAAAASLHFAEEARARMSSLESSLRGPQ